VRRRLIDQAATAFDARFQLDFAPQNESDMVDLVSSSSSSHRLASASSHQRKRLSSSGIAKSHKSQLLPTYGIVRKSPRCAKSALIQQRQREAAAQAIRRAGILLENEYRDEVRRYMHEMEVRRRVLDLIARAKRLFT
jgi:hypothetical protein